MGLYSHHIFPRLMDWVMSGDEFRRLRPLLLRDAQGEVLEIGLGTGLNLPHYPTTVLRLHAVDPVQLLPDRAAKRSESVSFPIQIKQVSAEILPFHDRTFDCVVSTWTLCTIPDPVNALREIRRVLKPTGQFLFLEHGRSENDKIAAWQDWLNPIQRIVGCGCNLNRRIDQLISQAGLRITKLDRFQMETVPRLGGEMYRGIATSS
jgi:ubiquinone/menaquinone biosynthesis C-methylase UbiE